MSRPASGQADLDAEVLSEELVEPGAHDEVRALPAQAQPAHFPVLRSEVRTAAIVAAGGALAGAATVAAVRAVSGHGSRRAIAKRIGRRQARPVVASRSFLVDVHLLER